MNINRAQATGAVLDQVKMACNQTTLNGEQPGSGRADGIAPVSPPTPPDMRFSASGGWTRRF